MVPALLVCAFALPAAPRFDAEGVPLPAEAVARVGSAAWRHHAGLTAVVASADGRFVLTPVAAREVLAWDADTGRLVSRFDLPRVNTRAELLRIGGDKLAQQVEQYYGEGDRRLQVAADGRLLVLDRHWDNGSVRAVDPLTGRVAGTATFQIPRLRGAAVTRDGRWLAAHTADLPANYPQPKTHFLHVRDLTTTAVAHEVPVVGTLHAFAFSPDDRLLAVADDAALRFLDPATGRAVRTVATGYWKRVSHFAFRPDAAALAVWVRAEAAPTRDRLEVWAVTGERLAATAVEVNPAQWRAEAVFRPDGGQLAVKTDQRPWRLVDATTGKETAALALPDDAFAAAAAYAADGRRLFVAGTGYYGQEGGWTHPVGSFVVPFDLTATPPVARHAPRPHPHHGTFARNGDYVAAHQGTLLRWQAGRVAETPLPVPLTDPNRAFAFSPAGDRLAVVVPPAGTKPGAVDVLDLATGRRTAFATGPTAAHGLQFTPDGRTLLAGAGGGAGWDLATGRPAAHPWAGDPPADAWKYHPLGGRWLTTGDPSPFVSDRKNLPKPTTPLRIYDRENWRGWKSPAWALRPDGWGRVALVSADGRRAVVDRTMSGRPFELWEGPAGRRRWAAASAATPHAFSPDARTIAATTGTTVELIETATGGVRHAFVGHRGYASVSHTGAFSPDGRLLAATSLDAPVLLWDVRGELQKPATPHLGDAWADLASPDAAVAFRAVRRLAWFPDLALPLLRAKLPPVPPVDAAKVAAHVAALDAPAFADRQAATKGLKELGDRAVPALEAALTATASAEVRTRIEAVLEATANRPQTADDLRAVRAVEAVEWIGTPAARTLLQAWAGGADGSRLTREAKESLARLKTLGERGASAP